MDAYIAHDARNPEPHREDLAPEVAQWLGVAGDLDDLIYFDGGSWHSDR